MAALPFEFLLLVYHFRTHGRQEEAGIPSWEGQKVVPVAEGRMAVVSSLGAQARGHFPLTPTPSPLARLKVFTKHL